MDNNKELLYRNNRIFRKFIEIIIKKDSVSNSYIDLIQAVSRFAFKCHPGIFFESDIENVILKTGASLDKNKKVNQKISETLSVSSIKENSFNGNKICHIATTLYAASGHTNFINNFIEIDGNSEHYLIVTDQGNELISEKILAKFKENPERLIFLEKSDYLSKAKQIREIIKQNFSMVFLHIHPYDPIPLIALADDQMPPVVFVNHADHAFWLGTGVSDIVANIRMKAIDLSQKRRHAVTNFLLPIPLENINISNSTKILAKKKLNIPDDKILGVAIGVFHKFIPNEKHDFFRTISRVLEQTPNLTIKIIGISAKDNLHILNYSENENIELLGVLEDYSIYKQAADIVIDPMPFGSYTSVLEFCSYGAYPMITYDTIPLFDLTDDPALTGLVSMCKTEDEYINHFKSICENNQMRWNISKELISRMKEYHCGQGWYGYLDNLYRSMHELKHNIKRLTEDRNSFDELDFYLAGQGEKCFAKESELLLNRVYENINALSLIQIVKCFTVIKHIYFPQRKWLGIKFYFSLIWKKWQVNYMN